MLCQQTLLASYLSRLKWWWANDVSPRTSCHRILVPNQNIQPDNLRVHFIACFMCVNVLLCCVSIRGWSTQALHFLTHQGVRCGLWLAFHVKWARHYSEIKYFDSFRVWSESGCYMGEDLLCPILRTFLKNGSTNDVLVSKSANILEVGILLTINFSFHRILKIKW